MVNIVDNTCNGNALLLTLADPVVAGLTHSTITPIALSSHLSDSPLLCEPRRKCVGTCSSARIGSVHYFRSNTDVGLSSAFEWSTGDRYFDLPVSFFCHDWGILL